MTSFLPTLIYLFFLLFISTSYIMFNESLPYPFMKFPILAISLYFSIFMSLVSFLILLSSKPGKTQIRSIENPRNIINQCMLKVKQNKIPQIPSEESICFTCLIEKPKHTIHCTTCDTCIQNFHLHSSLLKKCIGAQNFRSYFFFIFFNFISFSISFLLCYLIF